MPYIGQGLTEGRRRAYNFVATGGQTTFSATYDVGYVDVFQNGILLTSSDYTATNGTTVVLGVGASASDEVTIIAHQIFSVSDTVSAIQGGTFSNNIDVTGNITTTGSLKGPSSFTIDPATHGDNTGTVVIAGDLTVNGTTTTINSTTLTVDDKNIIIASGSSNSSTADGSGLTVDLGSDGTATMTYTHATSSFNFNKQIRGTGANFTEAVTFNGNNYNIAFYNTSNALKFFDYARAEFGTGGDLKIRHTGSHSEIKDEGTGQLRIIGNVIHLRNSANNETMLMATENGAVELYHDNVKKLETTSSGVTVTGTTSTGTLTTTASTSTDANTSTTGSQLSSKTLHLRTRGDSAGISGQTYSNQIISSNGTNVALEIYTIGATGTPVVFGTNSTERMRIHSSGSLTLGSTTPGIGDTAGTELTISDSIEAGITIRSGTSNHGNIYFSDATSGAGEYVGIIRYNHGSNYMMFQTNDSERMRIDSSGNVGIGTDNPSSPLHIQADGVALRMDGTGNTTRSLFFRNTTTSNPAQIYADGSLRLRTEDASTAIIFNTNSTGTNNERMRITSSGNVGIGVDDPQFKLHVNKGSSNYATFSGVDENIAGFQTSYDAAGSQVLTFSNLDGNWVDGTSGADSAFGWLWAYQTSVRGGLVYDHRGTERMQMFSSYGALAFITPDSVDGDAVPTDSNMNERLTILPGGNVGIGTASPSARLHVLNSSGSPAINTNDTDELVRLGTADGVHGSIALHATTKHSTLRSTVFRTTSSDNFGIGYSAYNTGTMDIGRVDQGYTWNGTNGNGEYTGGVAQQPRYMRKAHFSGQIIANNTYYTIAENMSESRFTIECFCGDASSRDYKKYVGYYTSQAYGVYGLTQVQHMNGGWNSGSFDMRVSVPNGNLSIDLRFSSYYSSSNVASWMCIYTSFV